MSENLLTLNIIIIIFYLLVEKLRVDEDLKKYALYPLRVALGLLVIVDLLVLLDVLSPFI